MAIAVANSDRASMLLQIASRRPFPEATTAMALHRDIYWVGKQWAVTGHGIQACNQKQKGQFDIEASRLWDDGVQEAVRTETWVNIEDFEKAVAAARKYYPEPPRRTSPPVEPASLPQAKPAPSPQPFVVSESAPKPAPPNFGLHVQGRGKLMPVWRIRPLGAARADHRPRG